MWLLPRPPQVFISYRRSAGVDLASRIRTALEAYGVDVYQDYTDLEKGEFTTQLLDAVENRIFLPVLTPGTLDRCRVKGERKAPFDENDWVLKEIIHAIEHDCVCIPLFTPNFDFADLHTFLPEAVAQSLAQQEGVKIEQLGLFDASIQNVLRHLDSRRWQRQLWVPATRRGIHLLLALLVLTLAGLLGLQIERAVNPPPPASIALASPTDPSRALGWPPNVNIADVAVSAQAVWLALESGLWLYHADTNLAEAVPVVNFPIQAVDTSTDGQLVWFIASAIETPGERVGWYDRLTGESALLTPTADGHPVTDPLLSLKVSTDGDTAWVGTNSLGIFQYSRADQTWENQLIHTPASDPTMRIPVTILGVFTTPAQTLFWSTNRASVYRGNWSAGAEWILINGVTTGYPWPSYIRDLAVDGYGQVWMAHDNGLSVLRGGTETWDVQQTQWLDCTPANSPLAGAPVFSLSTADDGQVMWLVSKGGVNAVETSEAVKNCERWQWYHWSAASSDDPFWVFANGSESNLRIDADSASSGSAWVFQTQNPQIRIYKRR